MSEARKQWLWVPPVAVSLVVQWILAFTAFYYDDRAPSEYSHIYDFLVTNLKLLGGVALAALLCTVGWIGAEPGRKAVPGWLAVGFWFAVPAMIPSLAFAWKYAGGLAAHLRGY